MQLSKKSLSILATLFALFICLGSSFISPAGLQAYAAESSNADLFDKTNVIDDLEGSELDDVEFKLEDYSFDESKSTSIFSFVEFCYSYAGNMQDDYGLYIYVHNPKGLQFDVTSERNMISLRAGSDTSKEFKKYHLEYLNCSVRENYEGLFYKFKVNLSKTEKEEILFSVNSAKREYRIGDMELLTKGERDVTSTKVGTSYYFEGYAAGYDPSGSKKSTLVMTSEQNATLQLKPQATQFRPDGSNGKSEYTQDSLHSVYFAVPNEFIDTYGEMAAIHATWLNAFLAPSLAITNMDAYDAIVPFLGEDIGLFTDALNYYCYGGQTEYRIDNVLGNVYHYYYGFNAKPSFSNDAFYYLEGGRAVSPLYLMIPIETEEDYGISSEELQTMLLLATKRFGGDLVNGKYSRVLFDSVDEEFTDITIQREEEYSLTKEVISRSWWDKLWGLKGSVSTASYDGIQAIYTVQEDDFLGRPSDICNRLYISESDYLDFYEYFLKYSTPSEDHPSGCTVYLFRYQLSDYTSMNTWIYTDPSNIAGAHVRPVDNKAYFFQEMLNIGFDIIDVTFSNGIRDTVIPVAMDPIDIIPGATLPLKIPGTTAAEILMRVLLAAAIIGLFVFVIGFIIYKIVDIYGLKYALGGSQSVNTSLTITNDNSSPKGTSSSSKKSSSSSKKKK